MPRSKMFETAVAAPTEEEKAAEEQKKFREQAQAFLDRWRETFFAIARDRSLKFEVGDKFCINLKRGVIQIAAKDWEWAEKNGLSSWQQVWSVCHELAHFHDLTNGPKEMLANFEYMEKRAKELEPALLDIWKKKLGKDVPDYLTAVPEPTEENPSPMSYAQVFLFKRFHLLYNCLDDMYVNSLVGTRVGAFAHKGSQAPETVRLYRDYLFPTDQKAIGQPPKSEEAVDYAKQPKSQQLAYYLLRRRMVPDQAVLVDEEVRQAVKGFSDEAAEAVGDTLEKEIDDLTLAGKPRAAKPGERYAQIRAVIEPLYVRLLMKDLEDMPPPPPPPPPGGKPGKGKPGDPWGPPGPPIPEPMDKKTIEDYLNQKKDKDKEDKKKAAAKKAKEIKDGASPEERDADAQDEADKKICVEHNIDPQKAREYRRLENDVKPYAKDLAKVFEEITKTISQQVVQTIQRLMTAGRLHVGDFIKKYGPAIAAEDWDAVPWKRLDTKEMREYTSRLMLYPDRVRLRLVLDGSGSMGEERIKAVRELAVLIMEGLGTLEATINLSFKLKRPFKVDTEIRMFGTNSAVVKPFTPDVGASEEMAAKFMAVDGIQASYGGTNDDTAFRPINRSIDSALSKDLKEGRARELVFEITDGGSQSEAATRRLVETVRDKGVLAYGFQICDPSEEEKQIFRSIWGEHGKEVPKLEDLAPAIAELLKKELLKTNFRVEYTDETEK